MRTELDPGQLGLTVLSLFKLKEGEVVRFSDFLRALPKAVEAADEDYDEDFDDDFNDDGFDDDDFNGDGDDAGEARAFAARLGFVFDARGDCLVRESRCDPTKLDEKKKSSLL